jgi:hypothetical protein
MSSRSLIYLITLVTLLAAGSSQTRAEDASPTQALHQWAADAIRGEDTSSKEMSATGDSGESSPTTIRKTFMRKVQQFLAQTGQLVEQRIGWLRPTSLKEQALVWMAMAFALPWAFVGWLRPILQHDSQPVRWIVVALWTSLSLWIAWISWGAPSGADRFASTMLIGLPVLLTYFNCVANSVAAPKNA